MALPPQNEPRVGSEAPLTPEHSLPSYSEPTPETHRKITREEEAEIALTTSQFSPGARGLLIGVFLLTILLVPLAQYFVAHSSSLEGIFKLLPTAGQLRAVRGPGDLWHLLPTSAHIKSAEKTVENDSVVVQRVRPHVQSLLTNVLKAGTEQVYPGRDGWLFYRPDVDYATGPPFLDEKWMKQRNHASGVRADPIAAIVDFHRQLATRGIELIVMPAPVKPSVDGEMLAPSSTSVGPWQNPSFTAFKAQLEAQGVKVFDPLPSLLDRKTQAPHQPLYLSTDTHWRPETMDFVAQELAAFLHLPSSAQRIESTVIAKQISGLGDIARMLDLPSVATKFPPEPVAIGQIALGNALWRSSRESRVLLLGDSFCNIYSLDAMGWGEAAGFAEHLSHALAEPLDCIVRNSDGAYATREILSQELAHGRERLAGKKYVIWEFAARELAFGNWKLLDLTPHAATKSKLLSLKPGESVTVSGTVQEISTVPRPGTVPYRDHVATVHLVDLEGSANPPGANLEALVCILTMKDNIWMSAARLRPGDRVTVKLRPWSEVSDQYEKINRSELENADLQLDEPAWAELVNH